jgi:DNA-binding GntR family transcriptional regulator
MVPQMRGLKNKRERQSPPAQTKANPLPHLKMEGRSGSAPIERSERVADQVYRKLRRAIILGDFAPSSRLREVEIAASLGVSRTPVREAISRLIGDHLVKSLQNGGVEVGNASAELSEIYYIREALEACAARLAAKRITDEQLGRLRQLLEASQATSYFSYDDRAHINEQFHMLIAEASGSRRLAEMIGSLREFFVHAAWLKRYDRNSALEALRQHKQLVSALSAHSENRVEQLVRQHLKSAYAKLLAEHPTSERSPRKKKPGAR